MWSTVVSRQFERGLVTTAVSSLRCKNRLGFNQKTIAGKSVSLKVLGHSRDHKSRRFRLDSVEQLFYSSEIFLMLSSPSLPHSLSASMTPYLLQSLKQTQPSLVQTAITFFKGEGSVIKKSKGHLYEPCRMCRISTRMISEGAPSVRRRCYWTQWHSDQSPFLHLTAAKRLVLYAIADVVPLCQCCVILFKYQTSFQHWPLLCKSMFNNVNIYFRKMLRICS